MVNSTWYRVTILSVATLALSAAPGLAGGADKGKSASGADSYKEQAADRDKAHPSASPATGAADYKGRHTMTGDVMQVDAEKGKLTLNTAEGTMELHFPPSALQDVKTGDRVSVELALKPENGGSASPRSGDTSTPGASPAETDKPKQQ
ncbi:MAG: hypothetical protein ACREJV_11090 [Candidatus Rokuibacteriota bacterium]